MKQERLPLKNNYCLSLHNMSKRENEKIYNEYKDISYALNYESRVSEIMERFSYQKLLTEG